MTPDDLRRFAHRDWAALDADKRRYWAERKARMTLSEVMQLAADLRGHALAVRPEWPTAADRADDAAMHQRVSEALRAVASSYSSASRSAQ